MSRTRKTDHDSVIGAARAVFWRRGFAGTSTRELEKSTGLTRFTLQTCYGGKTKFFLITLDAYLEERVSQWLPNAETTCLEDLAGWVRGLAEPDRLPEIGAHGCLLLSCVNEFDRSDAAVNARIIEYLEALQMRFRAILLRALRDGSAKPGVDPDEKARVVVNLLFGLSTIMRARVDDAMPKAFADAAASTILDWRS
ncbi:MAG: TetR family transcriptional regulator [Pseudomonadota bacterium]